ncbi:MAG: hypothetical protein ACI9WC_002924 [Arenicella sp.]|jgi:hypothetical protein
MIMKLKWKLRLKLLHSSLFDIALLMGYNRHSAVSAAKRIKHVLKDNCLGLDTGKYDFKYSNEEFLFKLISTLGLDVANYEADLKSVTELREDKKNRYKSFVYIDTGFKRTTEPIFALALCEGQRRIYLDYDVRVRPLYEQVEFVQSLVKKHNRDKHGNLGIWGDIQRYIFFYANGSKLSISTDGAILGELDKISMSKASLTVGNGKPLVL